MTKKLEELRAQIADYACEIEDLFSVPSKVTILVRHPTLKDGGVLVTNDDDLMMLTELNRLMSKARQEEPTEPTP